MALEDRLVRVACRVARREGQHAVFSVTCLDPAAMRRCNREHRGQDRVTDVVAFGLPQPDGSLVGDLYICPDVARAEAKARGIPVSEELLRLAVHGAMHALGYDHPEGPGRTRSEMWRRQEQYVCELGGRLP